MGVDRSSSLDVSLSSFMSSAQDFGGKDDEDEREDRWDSFWSISCITRFLEVGL